VSGRETGQNGEARRNTTGDRAERRGRAQQATGSRHKTEGGTAKRASSLGHAAGRQVAPPPGLTVCLPAGEHLAKKTVIVVATQGGGLSECLAGLLV
jgi:hypothetical protein